MVDKANVELLLLLIKESANIYPPNIKVIHTLSLYKIIGEVWIISIIIIQQNVQDFIWDEQGFI